MNSFKPRFYIRFCIRRAYKNDAQSSSELFSKAS
nr:MAG TPA: hypothetical protein [Caudoviricetes sp.]